MPENYYIEQVPIQRESTSVRKPLLDTGQRKIKVKEDKLAMEIAQQILSDARTQSNGIANGRFNTDYPLQTEHPELWVIPAAAEIKAAGLVPGTLRFAVGTVTGNEIGKQSTNIGQKIDSKLGTRIFAPTLGFIGGLGGYAFGSGFTGNMLSRIPRKYSYGPTNERTYWAEDQTPKYNPNQLQGLNRRLYQSPAMSQLEVIPQAAYASEMPMITKQNAASITDAQWDAAYNSAVKSGNIAEVQRLRDLHFAAKAPNTKIIDETGMPKEVYHGSVGEKFTVFDSSKTRPDYNYGTSTNMFSDNKNVALGYANNDPDKLHSVYLNLQNILERDFKGNAWNGSVDHTGKFLIVPSYDTVYSSKQEAEEALQKMLDLYYPNNPAKQAEQRHYLYVVEQMDSAHPEKSTNAFSDEIANIPTLDGGIVRNVKDYYDLPKLDENPELYEELTSPHTDYFVKDPRNIKSSAPITYDDSGQIIPLSKRDDFNDPDIRYAMSEDGLEGLRQRWFHTIIHPNHFYGKPDLEYAGIPKGDRNFKFKTMRFRMTPGESEAAQLWSKKRNIWDRYKTVTKRRGLQFNEHDEPLVPIVSSVTDTRSFDDPIFAQSNLVKVFQQYGGKNMLNESELKFKPEELQQGWIDYFNSPQYRERVRQNSGLSEPEIDRFINEMIANMKSAHHTYMTLPQIVEKKIPSYNPKTGDFDIKTVLAQGSEGGHYEPKRHLVVINNSRGKNTPVNFEHEDLHATLRPGTYPREVLDKSGLINGTVLNQINGIRGMVFPGEPLTFSNGLVEKPSFAQKPFNRYLAGRDEARVRGLKILRYLDEHNLPITEENVGKVLDEMNAYDANQLSSFTRQSVIDYLKKLYILPLTVGLGATAINKNQNK